MFHRHNSGVEFTGIPIDDDSEFWGRLNAGEKASEHIIGCLENHEIVHVKRGTMVRSGVHSHINLDRFEELMVRHERKHGFKQDGKGDYDCEKVGEVDHTQERIGLGP